MTHLIDSDTCIDHLHKGAASNVTNRLAAAQPGSVVLCSVVVAELLFGARRSAQVPHALAGVQAFCGQFVFLPFDDRAAEEYSKIRTYLTAQGNLIGPNDLMIAAIAVANGLILVTHNTAEFSRVQGLTLEDWKMP